MRIAYFDCFAGISGDMTLGALVDAGVDFDQLLAELAKLHLHGFEASARKVVTHGIAATDITVTYNEEHPHRNLSAILELIASSQVSDRVKEQATVIFTRLGEAEARVHNTHVQSVHFHEVGAVDAIVDIVGVCICLEILGVTRVYSSPMPTFHGSVETAHGRLPLPAPATVELLRQTASADHPTSVPWREVGIEGELVTPTGAAIISTLAERFGPMPGMIIQAVGTGAGKKDYGIPNVLRVFLGEPSVPAGFCFRQAAADDTDYPRSEVAILETNIDDLNPQVYEVVMDRLLKAGALDVYLTPIQMKKNRPATLVSVICSPEDCAKMTDILFEETTTIGVRATTASRICLAREVMEVRTIYGPIRVKVATRSGKVVNVQPEYEDCKAAAVRHGVAVRRVQEAAIAVFTADELDD